MEQQTSSLCPSYLGKVWGCTPDVAPFLCRGATLSTSLRIIGTE